jgi:hypothetical protein
VYLVGARQSKLLAELSGTGTERVIVAGIALEGLDDDLSLLDNQTDCLSAKLCPHISKPEMLLMITNHPYGFLSLSRLESSLTVGHELLNPLREEEEVRERVAEIALDLLVTGLRSRRDFDAKVSILPREAGRPLVSEGQIGRLQVGNDGILLTEVLEDLDPSYDEVVRGCGVTEMLLELQKAGGTVLDLCRQAT